MIGNMSREIDLMKRQTDTDRRSLEHLTREKDIMNKNIVRQQGKQLCHSNRLYNLLLISSPDLNQKKK